MFASRPLSGVGAGVFVEIFSLRWIFYVNPPVGVVAPSIIRGRVPVARLHMWHAMDYLGVCSWRPAVFVVLFTSLGGTYGGGPTR